MAKTTSRKTKVVGTQEYINPQTGEIEVMQVMTVEERDFNFTKVWMRDFLQTLDIVSNKKMKVANWVIDNINYENMLVATYEKIAEATGVSFKTVLLTMQALKDADFLRQEATGVYIVNPNVIYKGKHSSRLNALTKYAQAGAADEPETPEQRAEQLVSAIAKLQKELAKVLDEMQAASPSASAAGQSPAPSAESDYQLEPITEAHGEGTEEPLPVM